MAIANADRHTGSYLSYFGLSWSSLHHNILLLAYLNDNVSWRWWGRSTTTEWLDSGRPLAKEKLWSSYRHCKTKTSSHKRSRYCQGTHSEYLLITCFLWFSFLSSFLTCIIHIQLPNSNIIQSSGSSRRAAIASTQDIALLGCESDPTRLGIPDPSFGAVHKISSAQRHSPADQNRSTSARNISGIRNFESTLRGIESLHFNQDEKVQY